MCARYTLRSSAQAIRDLFQLDAVEAMPPRYNIAPTQQIPTVTQSREGERKLRLLRWGLVPSWAKSLAIGNQMINAKAETLAEKPAYRVAFERRRCLIPADGFFEWTDLEEPAQAALFEESPKAPRTSAKRPRKQPYLITLAGGQLFAFAGLWERWSDGDGNLVDSCAIVTTEPNELVAPLHERMPAIVDPENYALWLDRHERNPLKLAPLLGPYPAAKMRAIPVNPIVGNAKIDAPECVQPVWV